LFTGATTIRKLYLNPGFHYDRRKSKEKEVFEEAWGKGYFYEQRPEMTLVWCTGLLAGKFLSNRANLTDITWDSISHRHSSTFVLHLSVIHSIRQTCTAQFIKLSEKLSGGI
jgi:hypothetical protein